MVVALSTVLGGPVELTVCHAEPMELFTCPGCPGEDWESATTIELSPTCTPSVDTLGVGKRPLGGVAGTMGCAGVGKMPWGIWRGSVLVCCAEKVCEGIEVGPMGKSGGGGPMGGGGTENGKVDPAEILGPFAFFFLGRLVLPRVAPPLPGPP